MSFHSSDTQQHLQVTFFGSRSAASSAEIIRKQDLVPSSLKKSYLLNRREIWVIVIFIKMKYRKM